MELDSPKHHRRSLRLPGYDYSQAGAYFVTVVIRDRECLLGEVYDSEVSLSPFGGVVEHCWRNLSRHFRGVELDTFVVMPNHVHGVIIIHDGAACGQEAFFSKNPKDWQVSKANASPERLYGTQRDSLGAIIQNFKSISARKVNHLKKTPGAPLWQRNYFDHVIRDEESLNAVRQYIELNPTMWADGTDRGDGDHRGLTQISEVVGRYRDTRGRS